MLALPDLTEEFEAVTRDTFRRERVEPLQIDLAWAIRAGQVCMAAALFLATAGIWAFPAEDHAVVIVKLGASLAMAGGGGVLLALLPAARDATAVQIDLEKREIRTYEREPSGHVYLTGRHDLMAMAEVSLRNGTFFARDGAGRVVVSVPVRGRARERAIRGALALA